MILVCFLLLLTVVSYLRYWRGRGMKDFYSSEPMLFSHRGVTSDYPENTLEAYKESEKRGFNGIELDIISSRDGVLYCSHNHQLEQETDSSGYIHQMISTISSILKDNKKFVDVIATTFPMGSMTGAPKIKAMELIEEYEETKRGVYSGSVGYINPEGDFDFNVIIRSLLYDSQKKYLSLSVGGAIVSKSEAIKEYEECLIKAKPIFDIFR